MLILMLLWMPGLYCEQFHVLEWKSCFLSWKVQCQVNNNYNSLLRSTLAFSVKIAQPVTSQNISLLKLHSPFMDSYTSTVADPSLKGRWDGCLNIIRQIFFSLYCGVEYCNCCSLTGHGYMLEGVSLELTLVLVVTVCCGWVTTRR